MEALAVTGGILGPLLQYQGTRETNQANIDISNAATAANLAEAEKNRAWQEKMSSTAHQREVQDLIKAGINPMIGSQTGASTPSGGQGTAIAAKLENPLAGASGWLNSAVDSMKTLGEIKLQDKQAKLLEAQTVKTGVETEVGKRNLPEAQIKNKIYNYLNKKVDQFSNSSAWEQMKRDASKSRFNLTKP